MEKKQGTAIWVLVGCLGLFFVLVCGGVGVWVLFLRPDSGGAPLVDPGPTPAPGSDPAPVPAPMAGSPRRVVATVTEVTGNGPVHVGDACEFDVARVDRGDGTFWCNAQVTCSGFLLYGGPTAGFFDCTLYDQPVRHVVGGETNTTSADGDAAMQLDTLQGTLLIRDDPRGRYGGYSLRARVDSVR